MLLIVVLLLQQSEVMPSVGYRLAYLVAVMWPLYTVKRDAMPVVITLFFTITNYNFSYSYMPYEVYIYDILIVLGLLFGYRSLSLKFKLPSFLVIWLIIITLVDFLTEFKIRYISYSLIGIVLLWPYINWGKANQFKLMSWGFIIASTVLAISFLVFGRNYMESYSGGGGFDRQGWADPNYFGCVVGIGVILALIELIIHKYNLLLKTILVSCILVILACLALNASRGAILSVGLSVLVLVSLTKTKPIYKVLLALFVIVAIVVMNNMGYFDLLKFRISNDSTGGSGRITIWINKIDAFFKEANILNCFFGMGQEGGRALALDTNISTGFHNDFIAFFCEYGLIGLILFIKWLYYPIKLAKNNKWLVASVVCYIAACGLTLEPVTAGRFTYFVLWIYAIQLSVYQKVKYSYE